MKLLPHQIDALTWLAKKPKSILALDMGLGKTVIAAKTIKAGERVLVICPASLKINWEMELNLWAVKMPITIIKKKSEKLPKEGIVIINYDLLGKKVKKRAVANYDFTGFDRVIVDESHMIKNTKAVRTKITGRIINKTNQALLLSGTPMERPIDLYVPLISMGAIKDSYDAFGMKYCDPKRIYIGVRQVWSYRGLTNPEELKKILEPYMLRMLKEDVIDLPDKDISVVSLDLPISRQEKEYNLIDILKDPRPIGFEGLSELLHEQGLKKLPLAANHIKMRLETEKKIFVVAKHSDVIDGLYEKLKAFNPVIYDGRITATQKEKVKDEFQNNPEVRLLIGQISAVSTGLTLTAARHVIVVEPDWSFSNLMQVIDRVHRIGQTQNVTAELLTIHKSIDERVLYTTLEKKGFIQELMRL